ncbi:branched-chain amino acid ABC transporter permease [Paenibacillus alginolyticus]|uniref:branched-chain amino acid ABC transporter permease n=1 Tax=Paenibacillus alginolyticus TaxID=59839 RepID=UPI0015646269|nr:branched-chain amino acid ABC transporter permease [Paenibacillus frigoriresistens]
MYFLQLISSGLSLGSLYALIGLAFVLIYRASGVVNFAQGEMMMIGGLIGFSLISYLHIPFFAAYLIAVLVLFFFGFFIERYVFRRMRTGKVFSAVMVTIGLSSILQGLSGMVWGHEIREIPFPAKMGVINIWGIGLFKLDLYAIATTIVILILFSVFIHRHKLGRAMTASSSDLEASYLIGIPVDFIHGISWGVSSAVSVIAGIFIGSLVYLEPTMGVFALTAFPAIILGGLNSLLGAVVGGLAMGIIVNLAGGYLDPYIPGGTKEVVTYMVLLLVLMFRPYGLFGQKQIRRM